MAGIGLRRACPSMRIVAVVRAAEEQAGRRATLLAAPDFKANEPNLTEAAGLLGLDLVWIDDSAMAAAQPRCVTLSALVAHWTGHASVAEAAALAAAGPDSRLLVARLARDGATCALAQA